MVDEPGGPKQSIRSPASWLAVIFGVLAVVGFTCLAVLSTSVLPRALGMLLALLGLYGCYSGARQRLAIGPGGIEIRQSFRTTAASWNEIDLFEVRRHVLGFKAAGRWTAVAQYPRYTDRAERVAARLNTERDRHS